jgi:hypothetical protein
MGERSVETCGTRRSVTRLARRQVIALAVASSVLLAVTAGAGRRADGPGTPAAKLESGLARL